MKSNMWYELAYSPAHTPLLLDEDYYGFEHTYYH